METVYSRPLVIPFNISPLVQEQLNLVEYLQPSYPEGKPHIIQEPERHEDTQVLRKRNLSKRVLVW